MFLGLNFQKLKKGRVFVENRRTEVVRHTGPRLRGRVVKAGSQIGWPQARLPAVDQASA